MSYFVQIYEKWLNSIFFIKTHRDSQDFWVESLVQYVQISSHCQEGPISLHFLPLNMSLETDFQIKGEIEFAYNFFFWLLWYISKKNKLTLAFFLKSKHKWWLLLTNTFFRIFWISFQNESHKLCATKSLGTRSQV